MTIVNSVIVESITDNTIINLNEDVRVSTVGPPDYKDSRFAPDTDDGNTTTRNPKETSKQEHLYWYKNCSLDAVVAKHCYITGYNEGHPSDAVIGVNNVIGHYHDEQYLNCWWLAENGQDDINNNYNALDINSIMVMMDTRCKEWISEK